MLGRGNNSLVVRKAAQSFQLPMVVIVLGLIVAITYLHTQNSRENSVIEQRLLDRASEIIHSASLPNPTVELINGTEVIWQIPPHPIAVLFMAHGSGGSARNFWPSGPGCPNCLGLPEESQIVHDALTKSYAVIVLSSVDEYWSYGNERLRVKETILFWLRKNGLMEVPLFGLGASAGGYFLSVLANEVKFRGIVLMIASGLFDRMAAIAPDYPPTLFVHMPKDVDTKKKVDGNMEILRKAGIDVAEIKCMEFPLTPRWLADKIPGIDETTSNMLFKLLSDKGFIDASGYMVNDGRETPWKEALKQNNIALPHGTALMQHIEEELNLAYAFHEMTSLKLDQIFKWLDLHIR